MSETQLVKGILQALHLDGAFAWRTNAGLTVIGTGKTRRVVRGAPAGTPDILGILPGGIFFALEVKTPKGDIRESQLEWLQRARRQGACVDIVRSIKDARECYRRWAGTNLLARAEMPDNDHPLATNGTGPVDPDMRETVPGVDPRSESERTRGHFRRAANISIG